MPGEDTRASLTIEASVDDSLSAELRRIGVEVGEFGDKANADLAQVDVALNRASVEATELGGTAAASLNAAEREVAEFGASSKAAGQEAQRAFGVTERQIVETGAVFDTEGAQWVAHLDRLEQEYRASGLAAQQAGRITKTALDETQRELRESSAEAERFGTRTDRAFDLVRRSGSALAAGLGIIRRGIGLLTPGLAGLTAGLGGAFLVGSATRGAAEFQTALAQVATIADGPREAIAGLREEVRGIARDLGLDEVKTAGALYEALSSEITLAGGALNFVRDASRLAVGGIADVNESVDLLITALRVYGLDVSQAGRVSDQFFKTVEKGRLTIPELAQSFGQAAPIAQTLGASLEEVNAAYATLTGRVGASEAGTQIAALFRGLLNNADAVDEVFQRVGQRFDENTVRTLGLANTLEILARATNGSAEEILGLLGRAEAFNAVVNLTGPNLERYRRFIEEIRNSSGATESAFGTIFESDVYQARTALNALKIDIEKIGDTVLAEVAKIARSGGGLEEFLAPLRVGVGGFSELVAIGIRNLRDFVADVNRSIEELGGADAAAERLGTGFRLFGATVALAAKATVGGIAEIGSAVFQFLALTQDLGSFSAAKLTLGGGTFAELKEQLTEEASGLEGTIADLKARIADEFTDVGGAFNINRVFFDDDELRADAEKQRAVLREELAKTEAQLERVRGRIAGIRDEDLGKTLTSGVEDFLDGLRASVGEVQKEYEKLTNPPPLQAAPIDFAQQIAAAQKSADEIERVYGSKAQAIRAELFRALDLGDLGRGQRLELALAINAEQARQALADVRGEVERLKAERITLSLGDLPQQIEELEGRRIELQAKVELEPGDVDAELRKLRERGETTSPRYRVLLDASQARAELATVERDLAALKDRKVTIEASIPPLDVSQFASDEQFAAVARRVLAGLEGPTARAAFAGGQAVALAFSLGFQGAARPAAQIAAQEVEQAIEGVRTRAKPVTIDVRAGAGLAGLAVQLAGVARSTEAANAAAEAFRATQADAIQAYTDAVDESIQAELRRQAALGLTREQLRQLALDLRVLAREGDRAFRDGLLVGAEDFARFIRDDFSQGLELARAGLDSFRRSAGDALFEFIGRTGKARDALAAFVSDLGRAATRSLVDQALGGIAKGLGFGAKDTGKEGAAAGALLAEAHQAAEALSSGGAQSGAAIREASDFSALALADGGRQAGQAILLASQQAAATLASAGGGVAGITAPAGAAAASSEAQAGQAAATTAASFIGPVLVSAPAANAEGAAAQELVAGGEEASAAMAAGGQQAGTSLGTAGQAFASALQGALGSILNAIIGGAFAEGGVVHGGLGGLVPVRAFAAGGQLGAGQRSGFAPVSRDIAAALGGTAIGYDVGGPIVSSPHIALVGEGKLNEAIVPLPNGRSIPVEFRGPAGAAAQREASAALAAIVVDPGLAAAARALIEAAGALRGAAAVGSAVSPQLPAISGTPFSDSAISRRLPLSPVDTPGAVERLATERELVASSRSVAREFERSRETSSITAPEVEETVRLVLPALEARRGLAAHVVASERTRVRNSRAGLDTALPALATERVRPGPQEGALGTRAAREGLAAPASFRAPGARADARIPGLAAPSATPFVSAAGAVAGGALAGGRPSAASPLLARFDRETIRELSRETARVTERTTERLTSGPFGIGRYRLDLAPAASRTARLDALGLPLAPARRSAPAAPPAPAQGEPVAVTVAPSVSVTINVHGAPARGGHSGELDEATLRAIHKTVVEAVTDDRIQRHFQDRAADAITQGRNAPLRRAIAEARS